MIKNEILIVTNYKYNTIAHYFMLHPPFLNNLCYIVYTIQYILFNSLITLTLINQTKKKNYYSVFNNLFLIIFT